MRIRDAAVRTFTENLKKTSNPKLTDANVLELLAAVGDHSRASGSKVLAELTQPGLTRHQQFDLANKGMTANEKADLATVLDQSGYEMDLGAKNFLEALTGRAEIITTFGPLTLTGDQSNGIIGIAKPGATIEAINLSTAPEGRLHLEDTMVIGTADAFGKFQGNIPDMKEGDIIRMRTRAADGSTSDWLTIQARGIDAQDTRNAVVNPERMDLSANTDGTVSVTPNTARPLSEPGATLRFTNKTTGESTDVKVNENGTLPENLKLKGKAGDEFTIAASDGRNNTNFSNVAATLKVPGGVDNGQGVDLVDPLPHKDERNADGTSKYKLVRYTGPLFVDGPKPEDVRQGAIGDCYFPAALAAIAHTDPEVIKNMVKKNDDGTFTVSFYENRYSGVGNKADITVDGDLYVRAWGGPLYGDSLGTPRDPAEMELWFPIVEKAYAVWKGDYNTIGNGGVTGKVLSEVMGAPYEHTSLSDYNKDRAWQTIIEGTKNGWPMAAGTHGDRESARYTNTGVYANHAYSIHGYEEENGVKYVKLRNPWGQSEPSGNGPNDGHFRLELDKFAYLYSSLAVVKK